MASNKLEKALQDLRSAVLPIIKGYMLQEAPERLSVYYQRYLQANTTPDRKSKRTGNRYYSTPNTTNKLRTLYGNIQRALLPDARFPGNITRVEIESGEVVLFSGIDTEAKVKAGNRMTSLFYAQIHEEGLFGYKPRPFLQPGLDDFNREEMPQILNDIGNELESYYLGR